MRRNLPLLMPKIKATKQVCSGGGRGAYKTISYGKKNALNVVSLDVVGHVRWTELNVERKRQQPCALARAKLLRFSNSIAAVPNLKPKLNDNTYNMMRFGTRVDRTTSRTCSLTLPMSSR